MSDVIQKSSMVHLSSPSMVHQHLNHQQQKITHRNEASETKHCTGPIIRKRSRELIGGTDLLKFSSQVPQKKGSPFILPIKV